MCALGGQAAPARGGPRLCSPGAGIWGGESGCADGGDAGRGSPFQLPPRPPPPCPERPRLRLLRDQKTVGCGRRGPAGIRGLGGAVGGRHLGGLRGKWGSPQGSGLPAPLTDGARHSLHLTLPPCSPPHPNFRPCPHLSPSKLVRSALCVPAPLPSPSAPLTPGTSPGDKRLQPDPGFIESPLFSRLIPPCPPFLATGRGGPGGLGGAAAP